MIRLPNGIVPELTILETLEAYQREVTDAGEYAAQVEKAKERFSAYN